MCNAKSIFNRLVFRCTTIIVRFGVFRLSTRKIDFIVEYFLDCLVEKIRMFVTTAE